MKKTEQAVVFVITSIIFAIPAAVLVLYYAGAGFVHHVVVPWWCQGAKVAK